MARAGAYRGMLVSVGLAFVFWLLQALGKEHVDELQYRLEWTDAPAGMVVVNRLPEEARFRLRASGWKLLSSWFKGRTVRLDLARYGRSNLLLTDRNLELFSRDLPRDVTLLDVEPDSIRIDLDPLAEAHLPLVWRGDWTYGSGFGPSAPIALSSDSVAVQGPSRVVDTLRRWPVNVPKHQALVEDRSGVLPLEGLKALNLQVQPERIEYRVPVEAYTEGTLTVPLSWNRDTLWRFLPGRVELRFQAPLSQFDAISVGDFRLEPVGEPVNGQPIALTVLRAPEWTRNLRWTPKEVECLRRTPAPAFDPASDAGMGPHPAPVQKGLLPSR
jgi:hypothetical protein